MHESEHAQTEALVFRICSSIERMNAKIFRGLFNVASKRSDIEIYIRSIKQADRIILCNLEHVDVLGSNEQNNQR